MIKKEEQYVDDLDVIEKVLPIIPGDELDLTLNVAIYASSESSESSRHFKR